MMILQAILNDVDDDDDVEMKIHENVIVNDDELVMN